MRFFYLLLLLLGTTPAWAADMVMLTPPEGPNDVRRAYSTGLLRLALDKTRAEYGDYRIEYTPEIMNSARARVEVERNHYPNLLILMSFQNEYIEGQLDYVRFPIDLGITGYRICFVSPQAKRALAAVKTLDELRAFSIGQAVGWPDIDILRLNGFKVVQVPRYESLFPMVAANRFDLFCRGINELEIELKSHGDLKGLDYDRHIALAYPLLRFYFSHKSNKRLLERVGKGLQIAHRDGSLKAYWLQHNAAALRFAQLEKRKIFQLVAPNIERVDFDYRQYFFDPLKRP